MSGWLSGGQADVAQPRRYGDFLPRVWKDLRAASDPDDNPVLRKAEESILAQPHELSAHAWNARPVASFV